MARYVLTDTQWQKMAPYCKGRPEDSGRTGDNRRFVEPVLWIARTGCQGRGLPAEFGHWNSGYDRFRTWAKAGVFDQMFQAVSDEPDLEYAMVDGTIVPVHRHGHGAKDPMGRRTPRGCYLRGVERIAARR